MAIASNEVQLHRGDAVALLEGRRVTEAAAEIGDAEGDSESGGGFKILLLLPVLVLDVEGAAGLCPWVVLGKAAATERVCDDVSC